MISSNRSAENELNTVYDEENTVRDSQRSTNLKILSAAAENALKETEKTLNNTPEEQDAFHVQKTIRTARKAPYFHRHKKWSFLFIIVVLLSAYLFASPYISEVNNQAKRLYGEAAVYVNKGENNWITINDKAMNPKLIKATETANSLFVYPATRKKIRDLTEYAHFYTLLNKAQTELTENRDYYAFESLIKEASAYHGITETHQYRALLKTEAEYLDADLKQANYNRVYLPAVDWLKVQKTSVQKNSSIYMFTIKSTSDQKVYRKNGKSYKKFTGFLYPTKSELTLYINETDAGSVIAADETRKDGLMACAVGIRKNNDYYADFVSWYPSPLTIEDIKQRAKQDDTQLYSQPVTGSSDRFY